MADQKELKQAQATFKALCAALDENDWHYDKDEKNLTVVSGARGDDLPIHLNIEVDAERQLVILTSVMPYDIPEDKRTALAVAVSLANWGIVDGSFDYSFLKGKIVFRMTSSFIDSVIDKEVLEYMVFVSCRTVDEYNEKFLAVAEKEMSLQDILNYIK